jgi:UDP-N-acetylmuramoylalanine--D-glutamate ligase
MLKLKGYNNKNVGVLGLGISGMSAYECLQSAGANVIVWDDNLKDIKSSVRLTPIDDQKWLEIEELVISPGIPHRSSNAHPLINKLNKQCKIFCDIELFYKHLEDNNKTIAITGTNGKSTTTALVGHIINECGLEAKICGNIGVAVTSVAISKNCTYILELSSYQLDKLIDAKFNISALTNITPDHLVMHGGMEGYIQAKKKIFSHQGAEDYSIVCIDDGDCMRLYRELSASSNKQKVIPVSKRNILNNGISLVNGVIYDGYFTKNSVEFMQPISLSGAHNSENVIIAIAACLSFGLKIEQIKNAISSFQSLEHRAEFVGEYKGVKFINDSKGTNFESTRHCLAAFKNIHWILGGVAKEGGIDGFDGYKENIKSAYLIGQSQDQFAKNLSKVLPYHKCGDLYSAFKLAMQSAVEGDVILLSPSCASFDQWKNFEERGKAFKKLFAQLNA